MGKSKKKFLHLVVAVVGIATLMSCVRSNDAGGKLRTDLPLQLLRDGDLLFRCGTSLESRLVINLDSASSEYSHVGIAINQGGRWMVVHAVPGECADGVDRVKVEPIDTFFMTSRAQHGAAMRLHGCDAQVAHTAAAAALSKCGTLFDSRYHWTDTTHIYCTQLIDMAYCTAGVDLLGDDQRGRLQTAGSIAFPSDLIRRDSLTTVFSF